MRISRPSLPRLFNGHASESVPAKFYARFDLNTVPLRRRSKDKCLQSAYLKRNWRCESPPDLFPVSYAAAPIILQFKSEKRGVEYRSTYRVKYKTKDKQHFIRRKFQPLSIDCFESVTAELPKHFLSSTHKSPQLVPRNLGLI